MLYKLIIEPKAILDIQDIIDYYDERLAGLGKKFEMELNKHLQILQKTSFFQVRYDNVHCLPLKKYPFMVHYTIDEKSHLVIIRAVFHTSQNPEKWRKE